MAITILLYPWDIIKQEYLDEGIPFTFGEMTIEYYNDISQNYVDDIAHREYGLYIDNVISQGTNIFSLGDGEMSTSAYGFTETDFYKSEATRSTATTKYKVSENLYCRYKQTIVIIPQGSGKADINVEYLLEWSKTDAFNSGDVYTNSPYFNSTRIISLEKCTYSQFIAFNGGKNPCDYFRKNGWYWGLNGYPQSSDMVADSITTTGCLIQSYVVFNKSDVYYTPDLTQPFGCWQFPSDIEGIRGSVVKPYDNGGTIIPYYVPLILGYGYEPQFPPSAEDNIVGGYNNDSDEGDIPSLPEQSAIRSGMVRLYQMTTTQLNAFAKFLWNTDLTDWDNLMNTLKQWFSNPLDSIISLSISPVDMFYNYTTKTKTEPSPSNIKLGGFDTGVQGLQCSNNYIQISLGKLSLKPYYKSYLDCNPHTKFSLYLPYISFKDIDGDVIFSKGATDIEVVYTIDVLTGVCVANVLIEKESNGTKLKHVIYTFSGNVNTTIPISSANMKDFISASVGAIASGVGMVASGGSITPVIMGSMLAQQGLNIASQKMNVAHSGGMALESGMFGIQYAYLIATRPREARPSNYKNLNGIPSEIGGKLITFTGFTQVSSVKVDIPSATDEEKNEIEKLLKEGIFI